MNDPVIKKTDIVNVRDNLKQPLFSLIKYMNLLGWDFELSMPDEKGFGYVSFSKCKNWHNRPILSLSCSYGYRLDKSDEESVTNVAQRSAELCITLYETFIEILPSTPNIHGEIKPCLISNKSEFKHIKYDEFIERHKDKQFLKYEMYQKDWLAFSYYQSIVTIERDRIPLLKKSIALLRRKIIGEVAIDC